MVLDVLVTVFILGLLGRQGFLALQVWGGPYEEKGKFLLVTFGLFLGAFLTLFAVWL